MNSAAKLALEAGDHEIEKVRALVQLLRHRSYAEIRQRMYENPPGSAWWAACKIELEMRNNEQIAICSEETSLVLDKMRVTTEEFQTSTGKFLEAVDKMCELLEGSRQSGRRVELASYLIIALTVLQLFYVIFQLCTKH